MTKDTLTYFTKSEVSVGSIVSIPLRKSMAFGLVTSSKVAEELKSELKSLSYSIKKIENIKTLSFLSKSFIESCEKIADYNASSVGSVLWSLIPKIILENSNSLSTDKTEKPKGIFHETLLLQSDDEERYATYKSLIREEFAKNRSVFFCLPTTENLLSSRVVLEKGIEKYTFVLHSGLSKKEILTTWNKIIESEHPVLIISTGYFLSIPKSNLGTIILDKESSRSYKMQHRPFIDIRSAAEAIAKSASLRLVLGDIFLRVETLWQEKNPDKSGAYSELFPLKFRSLTTATCELLNTKTPQDMKKKEFNVFSDKLRDILLRSKENNERTFLFCGRKGLYPITVCSDCGTVVTCKNCNSPAVLYSKKSGNVLKNLFVCHHCGERRDAGELCKHCGGWRLNPLGIGIDKVVEELKTLIPDANVFIMDKDHVENHKQAVKVRDQFYSSPGSFMVGTEIGLSYLNQKVENSAVVSIDSYFSVPDFQINEKIFHIILEMRSLTNNYLLLQTRQDDTKIFDYALRGNLVDFYRDEIEDRKSIGYPPFTTYIKVSLEGEKTQIKKQMNDVAEFLKPFQLQIYDAWNPGSKSKYHIHGLIGLPRNKWVDESLLSKLRSLPQQFEIKIDPATLL